MAGSRLERIGTIYSRTTGLIKSGALSWDDRPLWYDIYEAFPPQEEPRFDRPAPNIKLKKIFYKEDEIRAVFHRNNKYIGAANMFNNHYKSLTQKFIEKYHVIEDQYKGEGTKEQIYADAIESLKREKENQKEATVEEVEPISLSTAFKEAKSSQKNVQETKINLDVKNIFKD
ncbi:hypothetical protein NQ318_008599 [Aromia moschata]|uniref:Small ribosomal subunit protein mS23 n=1 Tax=Aromia moschata TaxID=1265417 RepID=A0AAV8YYC4_9CUCU|nr:hypothetical protein NQ318_008599 [Aromia moschata]